ncbi:MAG: hypothetical protein ACYC1E_17685 [Propionibacteriaceae bacterium]
MRSDKTGYWPRKSKGFIVFDGGGPHIDLGVHRSVLDAPDLGLVAGVTRLE